MVSIELSPALEKQFYRVIDDSYQGNIQAAISAFLKLHEKYGWKEQLNHDVAAIRECVHRAGGISEQRIEDAIRRHREQMTTSHG
ncbi:MAG: hypothetical protein R2911_44535 [Caldilineaceae bacterium]